MSSFWGAPSVNAETSFKNTVKNLLGRLPSAGQKQAFEPLCSPQFAHCESPPRWFRLFQGSSDRVRLLHFPGTR